MFGMGLQQDLDELERIDPQVRAAGKRYDEAIRSLLAKAEIEPTMKLARKQAMLDLVEERVKAMDQDGLSATLVTAARRGNGVSEEEVAEIISRQDHDVQKFWTGICPCGRSLH